MALRFTLSSLCRSRKSAAALRPKCRGFRSEAALDALEAHIRAARGAAEPHHLVLYNYPSFAGAFAALFAHRYLSHLRIPFLTLPFSSVEPFRVEDFCPEGIDTCYLLDFIGPKSLSVELARFIPRVIAFDHRKVTAARIPKLGRCPENLELHIDTNRSSACAVYDYFCQKLNEMKPPLEIVGLLNHEDEDRVITVIKYIEDIDLCRWKLPDIKAFNIGLKDERSKLNSVINPHVFEQLLEINLTELINKGKCHISSRENAARELVGKPFKIQLGRGVYGECLAIRTDGNSDLSHEIAVELSKMSAAAGLRSIGAVVFMQRGNLKMCLRTTDSGTDTSEIAKAYGGGGCPGSSSFIIRMDEYNYWTSVNSL